MGSPVINGTDVGVTTGSADGDSLGVAEGSAPDADGDAGAFGGT